MLLLGRSTPLPPCTAHTRRRPTTECAADAVATALPPLQGYEGRWIRDYVNDTVPEVAFGEYWDTCSYTGALRCVCMECCCCGALLQGAGVEWCMA